MQNPRLLLIHNPKAGALRRDEQQAGARTIQSEIRKTLSNRHEWIETRSAGEARSIAANVSLDRFQVVVAVGGDGTVHEVVEGIMEHPRSGRPAIGVLPAGSGNDFAYALGIPTGLREALDIVLHGSMRPVDIGRVHDNLGRNAIFDNSLGVGFDALVTMQAQKIRRLRGFARYFSATLTTIAWNNKAFEFDIEIDRLRFQEKALMITLGNGPREGGGFYTTPTSQVDDGVFELLLIKSISRASMLGLLPRVLKGTHLTSSAVYLRSFQHLKLWSAEALPVHLDGEIFGDDARPVHELEVSLENHAVKVLA